MQRFDDDTGAVSVDLTVKVMNDDTSLEDF